MKIYIIQFINYSLSFLMWMILGRMILTLMVGSRDNLFTKLFSKITDPVYRATRKILPFAQERLIPVIAVLLIIALRLALIILTRPATRP